MVGTLWGWGGVRWRRNSFSEVLGNLNWRQLAVVTYYFYEVMCLCSLVKLRWNEHWGCEKGTGHVNCYLHLLTCVQPLWLLHISVERQNGCSDWDWFCAATTGSSFGKLPQIFLCSLADCAPLLEFWCWPIITTYCGIQIGMYSFINKLIYKK